MAHPQRLKYLYLLEYLGDREAYALDPIVRVEPAVDAVVGAVVGDIQRGVELYGAPKAPLRHLLCLDGHRSEVRFGRRRDEGLEVFEAYTLALQGSLHILGGVLQEACAIFLPVPLLQLVVKCHSDRLIVAGDEASRETTPLEALAKKVVDRRTGHRPRSLPRQSR